MRRPRLPLALLPLAMTYLAVAMNMTIANVALPTISKELVATASQLTWVVNATPVTAGALILFAGALGDRAGHRKLLIIGIVVFTLAAAATALAQDITQLIALRALAGVGSALAMPSALALTFAIATGGTQRTAVGIMAATQAIGAMLGPIIGGAALVAFNWPAAFWSVAPMLVAALVGIVALLPVGIDSQARSGTDDSRLDSFGAALAALAMVALLVAAMAATSEDSSDNWRILGGLGVAGLAGIGLVVWERRVAHPIFDPAILRKRAYWVPTVVLAFVQFTLGGLLFVSAQYLQLVLGYSAFGAGLLLVPALLMWTLTASSAGFAARRFGVKAVTALSLVISAFGLLLLSRAGVSTTVGMLLVAMLLTGTMGVAPALMTHAVVNNYPAERRGVGAALNSVVVRFGMAFGVAAYGALLTSTFLRGMTTAEPAFVAAGANTDFHSLGGALRVAQTIGEPTSTALEAAARDAFVSGFGLVMLIGGAMLLLLALLTAAALPRQFESPPQRPPARPTAPAET